MLRASSKRDPCATSLHPVFKLLRRNNNNTWRTRYVERKPLLQSCAAASRDVGKCSRPRLWPHGTASEPRGGSLDPNSTHSLITLMTGLGLSHVTAGYSRLAKTLSCQCWWHFTSVSIRWTPCNGKHDERLRNSVRKAVPAHDSSLELSIRDYSPSQVERAISLGRYGLQFSGSCCVSTSLSYFPALMLQFASIRPCSRYSNLML